MAYRIKLYDGDVGTSREPIYHGFAEYSAGDSHLRATLFHIIRTFCGDKSKSYSVQIWDEQRQAWYIPSSGMTPGGAWDGLIPVEAVVMVGSLRL